MAIVQLKYIDNHQSLETSNLIEFPDKRSALHYIQTLKKYTITDYNEQAVPRDQINRDIIYIFMKISLIVFMIAETLRTDFRMIGMFTPYVFFHDVIETILFVISGTFRYYNNGYLVSIPRIDRKTTIYKYVIYALYMIGGNYIWASNFNFYSVCSALIEILFI